MFAEVAEGAKLDARLEVRVNAAGFPVVVRKGEKWSAGTAESKADGGAGAAAAKGAWIFAVTPTFYGRRGAGTLRDEFGL